jgi:proton-dependent oligopeptide transporter, POT family
MRGFMSAVRTYPRSFWVANIIELFERWGWYGFYMVLALYLTGSVDTGAVGLSKTEQGMIMGIGTAILYFLPVITGAIADRVGYKRILLLSLAIYVAGFMVIGQVRDFAGIFVIYLVLALGSALFKPVPAATISHTTDESTSSIGFGLYYMMVNVGALIGPLFASRMKPDVRLDEAGAIITDAAGKPLLTGGAWHHVFWLSAAILALAFVITLLFYREPARKRAEGSALSAIGEILGNVFTALRDIRLVVFLVLIIGFWTMFNQLYYTLPIFIDQWVDTSALFNAINSVAPWLASAIGTANGTIPAEVITTFDAFYIVLFQLVVSTLVMKWRPINAMITGIFVGSIGMGLSFLFGNAIYTVLALFIFGVGEMACSPRIIEYLGSLAPGDKRAMYVGCYFIPIAGGNFFAGLLSSVYEAMSDKVVLLQREVAARGLDIPAISESFTQNDFIRRAGELMGMNGAQLTDFLWRTYQPYNFWLVVVGIGVGTTALLLLYHFLVLKPAERKKAAEAES